MVDVLVSDCYTSKERLSAATMLQLKDHSSTSTKLQPLINWKRNCSAINGGILKKDY
jgi:hypothetical protein